MKDKFIKLLERQIERLELSDFDLEAWKAGTVSALTRVFNESDARIAQIENLKIDYSSWALRDSNSKYNPVETCKKKGKSILETAIDELSIVGINASTTSSLNDLLSESDQDVLAKDSYEEKVKHFKAFKKDKLVQLLLAAI